MPSQEENAILQAIAQLSSVGGDNFNARDPFGDRARIGQELSPQGFLNQPPAGPPPLPPEEIAQIIGSPVSQGAGVGLPNVLPSASFEEAPQFAPPQPAIQEFSPIEQSVLQSKGDVSGGERRGGGTESNRFVEILKQLAIPAITTGVGLGVPGALPGAAGFAQGFGGEQQRQRRRQEGEELILLDPSNVDPETGKPQETRVKIKASDRVKILQEDGGLDFSNFNFSRDASGDIVATEKASETRERIQEKTLRQFSSLEEADAADLPTGTKVLIGAKKRKAIIE